MKKRTFNFWAIAGLALMPFFAPAQIIFPESFSVLLDSARTFKGSFTPEVKIQTQKRLLVELNSLIDLVFRMGENNSFSVAQKFEFTSFGKERVLSGGYVFTKWKSHHGHRWTPEYFSQVQWADARGLANKVAVGANMRLSVFREKKHGLFAEAGGFFEREKWNFNGVPDERLPPDRTPVVNRFWKANFYLSYKSWLTEQFFVDLSLYYQGRFDHLFSRPRLASSSEVAWQLTQYLQLGIRYQNIYDAAPVVPIDSWFHRFVTAFSVSF